jgi:hypothetical protein
LIGDADLPTLPFGRGIVRAGNAVVGACLTALLLGCPSGSGGPKVAKRFDPYANNMPPDPFEDWYPESIAPPEGTRYPFLLSPLRDVTALPGLDQPYMNHVMAQLVTVARANLLLAKGLGGKEHDDALANYSDFVGEAVENIEAEDVPEGLRAFHDNVVDAIALQRIQFEKAGGIVAEHMAPVFERADLTEIILSSEKETALKATVGILEGKAASAKLVAAWTELSARYTGHWSDRTRDAMYSHLRAMDL